MENDVEESCTTVHIATERFDGAAINLTGPFGLGEVDLTGPRLGRGKSDWAPLSVMM